MVKVKEVLPWVLVDGYKVLRAMARAVLLEAEPPGCEMPPDVEGGRWKREAR